MYVAVVSYGCYKTRSGMLYILQVFQKHVASVCSKCFICFRMYVAIFFYMHVAYVFTHMLQYHVLNVSAVSVLRCSKCFFMLQLFYLDVAYVLHTCCKRCSKYFICFECMLHSSVSCCKCRPPWLVSMRVDRAKPRPPMREGGAGRPQRCVE
jgi:hypothetical protein